MNFIFDIIACAKSVRSGTVLQSTCFDLKVSLFILIENDEFAKQRSEPNSVRSFCYWEQK